MSQVEGGEGYATCDMPPASYAGFRLGRVLDSPHNQRPSRQVRSILGGRFCRMPEQDIPRSVGRKGPACPTFVKP